MAEFTTTEKDEIMGYIAEWMEENGKAMEVDEEVPVLDDMEALDSTYTMPLLERNGQQAVGFVKVPMDTLMAYLAGQAAADMDITIANPSTATALWT